MPLFYEADIDVFFSDFAVDALLTSVGAGTKTIKVIFDKNGFSINPYTGEVANEGPEAQAKTTDVNGTVHKETLAIAGIVYEILEVIHDGNGFTTLKLNKI